MSWVRRYWRWIRAAGLTVLAAASIWSAWRLVDRSGPARNRAYDLGRSSTEQAEAHARADALEAQSDARRATATRRIEQIRASGALSMADRLERLNDL